jgi:TRAP-type C4-dicarboxylate transport system permease small subunit
MQIITSLVDRLFRVVSTVAGVVFLIAIAINFANVIGRYFFHVPIFWAEEIVVYGIIWCVMLGAALVFWQGQHLRVEIIELFLSVRSISRLRLLVLAVVCLVAVATTYFGIQFVLLVADMDQRSVATQLPMAIPFAAVPVGFLLIVVASAIRLSQRVRAMRTGQDATNDCTDLERSVLQHDGETI